MHTLLSFLVIFCLIFSYLILYHKVDITNFLDVMHSAFTRQFIFELIPFIILFTTRELKFIDLQSSSNFFNSVIGRSMIGMIAFTFATYSLSSVNPIKIGSVMSDPLYPTLRLNSFSSQKPDAPLVSQKPDAPLVSHVNDTPKPEHFHQSFDKKMIEPNEKLLPYALIN